MKYFIITIDTEGDNLWKWKPGEKITTENSKYLFRFQQLANEYGFKPVWLTNYEMLHDERYIDFASEVAMKKSGEIGMHLHAWNSPPEYPLEKSKDSSQPYLIEYPEEIIDKKIAVMTELIEEKIGFKPVSHRAGRWATNSLYFEKLIKYGYKVDCSITPHINWSKCNGQSPNSQGSDYSLMPETPYLIDSCTCKDTLLEVPVSVKRTNKWFASKSDSFMNNIKSAVRSIYGSNIWLRPNGKNFNKMKWLIDEIKNSENDYAMFMIHSSELMPGGSPTFPTNDSIEALYVDTEKLFRYVSKEFEGITLMDYETCYRLRK